MSKQYVAQMQHSKMTKINQEFQDQFQQMNQMYQVQIQKYSQLFDELKQNYVLKIKDYEAKFQLNEHKMGDLATQLESLKAADPLPDQSGVLKQKQEEMDKKVKEYHTLKTNLDEFTKQVDMKNDFAEQVVSKKEEIIEKSSPYHLF